MKRPIKRAVWTPEAVRKLKSLAKRKRPAREIAKRLRRTENATRQKACSLGLSLDSRGSKTKPSSFAFAHLGPRTVLG
jgi:hypothetical protein